MNGADSLCNADCPLFVVRTIWGIIMYFCSKNIKKKKIMTTKGFYNDLTPEEQAEWVDEFARLSAEIPTNMTELQRLFEMMTQWPFAKDFCEKALRYGDFSARVQRLPVYIEKVKAALAEGLVTTDTLGNRVAVIVPKVPMRRRGRPSNAEIAARLRGEVSVPDDDTPESRKRRAIAQMLGVQVVMGEAPREKNNAELAMEREEKRRKEEAMNPSLFGDGRNNDVTESRNNETPAEKPASITPPSMTMGDVYRDRIEEDRLRLHEIKWLCSKELQERIDRVRDQRTAFGDAAQTAKVLAEHNVSQNEIASWAKKAEEAREAFESTYAAVDDELAVLFKRLELDVPFTEKFKARFKGVDIEKVMHITRPYYEKVRREDPAIDARIKRLIEQDSPEYAAKMRDEEKRKQEITDLLRYIKRKDKPNVKQRIETMEKRYARLVELLGEEEAKVYRPIVDAAIEDYEKNHKKPDADTKASAKQATKQERKISRKQSSKKQNEKED